MTFDEAAAHIGNSVLIHDFPRLHEGATLEVDQRKRMVKVRVRRKRAPYAFLPRHQWWHPAHFSIPAWWTRRQETA